MSVMLAVLLVGKSCPSLSSPLKTSPAMLFWLPTNIHYTSSISANGTRRPASADRTARRQLHATGQPMSQTQASDAMTSRLPCYDAKCLQRRCFQCGLVPLRSDIEGTELPPAVVETMQSCHKSQAQSEVNNKYKVIAWVKDWPMVTTSHSWAANESSTITRSLITPHGSYQPDSINKLQRENNICWLPYTCNKSQANMQSYRNQVNIVKHLLMLD